jgi:hypothetical protein
MEMRRKAGGRRQETVFPERWDSCVHYNRQTSEQKSERRKKAREEQNNE